MFSSVIFFWNSSISLYSSSLNIFLPLLPLLVQIIEKSKIDSKMYDILGLLNLLQAMQ